MENVNITWYCFRSRFLKIMKGKRYQNLMLQLSVHTIFLSAMLGLVPILFLLLKVSWNVSNPCTHCYKILHTEFSFTSMLGSEWCTFMKFKVMKQFRKRSLFALSLVPLTNLVLCTLYLRSGHDKTCLVKFWLMTTKVRYPR